MAETNQTDTLRWLAKSEIAPPFRVPGSKAAWETQRKQVRAQLWELLGKLPPRPKAARVDTALPGRPGRLRGGEVPIRQRRRRDGPRLPAAAEECLAPRRPAILYCHWHGGEYDIGKEELFQAKHTPEPPGPAFATARLRRAGH